VIGSQVQTLERILCEEEAAIEIDPLRQ